MMIYRGHMSCFEEGMTLDHNQRLHVKPHITTNTVLRRCPDVFQGPNAQGGYKSDRDARQKNEN